MCDEDPLLTYRMKREMIDYVIDLMDMDTSVLHGVSAHKSKDRKRPSTVHSRSKIYSIAVNKFRRIFVVFITH